MLTTDNGEVTLWGAFSRYCAVLYTSSVHNIRKKSRGSLGLLSAFLLPMFMCALFLLMFEFFKSARPPIRGDMVTFLLTGIYLFLLCIMTKSAAGIVPSGPMMYHQPVQPILLAWAGGIATLYIMVVSMIMIFSGNYLLNGEAELQNPYGMIGPLLVTWLFGIGAGMFITGVTFYTGGAQFVNLTFQRLMFLTSGKFFVANSIPAWIRPFMEWNPIFHTIDQMRDATFVNYTARTTSITYPLVVSLILILLGHIMERRVRRDFSVSGG